jgi:hypothetical protein
MEHRKNANGTHRVFGFNSAGNLVAVDNNSSDTVQRISPDGNIEILAAGLKSQRNAIPSDDSIFIATSKGELMRIDKDISITPIRHSIGWVSTRNRLIWFPPLWQRLGDGSGALDWPNLRLLPHFADITTQRTRSSCDAPWGQARGWTRIMYTEFIPAQSDMRLSAGT